jgi:hypothetical protein
MAQANLTKPDTLHLPPEGGAVDPISEYPPLLYIV